jgi:signal transduction histidine kinase
MVNLILAGMLGALLAASIVWAFHSRFAASGTPAGIDGELTKASALLQAKALLCSHYCRRISRQLHDGISQDISLMKLNLHLYKNNQQQEHLQEMQDLMERSIIELRSISRKMQPEEVNGCGIRKAIDTQIQFLKKNFPICCIVDDPEELLAVSRPDSVILYSLLEELLMNAAQHANADRIQLIAETLNGRQSFTILDNGRGFEPDTVVMGQGLTYVMEQVKHIGAEIKIDSAPGKGTRIVMVL